MSIRLLYSGFLLSSSGLVLATAAHGQVAAAAAGAEAEARANPEDDDGEIVVTGRGRSEELDRAPVSVTAFSSQDLTDARVRGVSDFIALTPGVSIVQSQSAGISFVTIRGIAQVRNGESPVAVVTDGVQQVNSRQFTSDLFDVKQIEILRGPQGALYGRNAIGGAIVITTEQPTNDFHAKMLASVGNGSDRRLQASVSGPIVADKLLFRIAGSYRDFGGLFRNDFLGKTADKLQDKNIRGQLKAFLGDTLTADLRAKYSRTEGDGYLFQNQRANYDPARPCFVRPAGAPGAPLPDADRVSRDFCTNNRGSSLRNIFEASIRLEKEFAWGRLTNTSAYVDLDEYIGSDGSPYSADVDLTQTGYEAVKSFQNDFRVASNDDGRFKWMFGAFFLKTTRYRSAASGFDVGQGILPIRRDPAFGDPRNPTRTFLADNNRNQTYAFYGSLGYALTDQLNVELAYRYDHDRRRQIINPLSTAGVPTGCTATSDARLCSRTAKFHKGQPKITVNYTPTDNITLFADYGIGFRSGQFNQSGAAAQANLPTVLDLVKAESASTAEAGIKAKLFGGKLKVKATGYYTIDKNPFYFVFVPAANAQVLVNIDKGEIYGGEIEANVSIVDDLDIFASYSLAHSKITKFGFSPVLVGNRLPYIPRDGGVIGAQYRFAMNDDLGVFMRGEVEHHGKQYWDPQNSSARSSFRIVNLQLGIEGAAQTWSLTGYVRNLADKKYNAEFTGGFVQPAQPRTYGLDFTYKI